LKLNRYAFALKEAVKFLQKPVQVYEQWLNADKAAIESKPVISKFMFGVKRTSLNSALKPNKEISNTSNGSSLLEDGSLECMRLSLKLLLDAQTYANGVDDGSINLLELTEIVKLENESMALSQPQDFYIMPELPKKIVVEENLNEVIHEDTVVVKFPEENMVAFECESCKKFKIENDTVKLTLQSKEKEIKDLQEKMLAETNSKNRYKKAREVMDEEVEELTSTLFDQANFMVIQESRARDDLNIKNKELQKSITSLKMLLATRELAMVELKRVLFSNQQIKQDAFSNDFDPSKSHTLALQTSHKQAVSESSYPIATISSMVSSLQVTESVFFGYSHTIVSGFDDFRSFVGADGILFREFQEFIRSVIESEKLASQQAMASTMATLFIKRCITEDVEPCLWYNYHVAASSSLSQSVKKRLLDFAIRGQIEIRLFIPSEGSPSPKSKQPDTLTELKSYAYQEKCFMCTILRDCEYELRFGPLEKQPIKTDWNMTCRFCRDRLTASLDFFTFLGYLRQGHIGPGRSGATILSLFRQMMWLRRRMHMAKVGSCSMFETEVSALMAIGGGVDSDKYISIVS
jgi:thiol-disulfide isomerase/thioredoxin